MNLFKSIKALFQRPVAQPVTFHPNCDECQQYRSLIAYYADLDSIITNTYRRHFSQHIKEQHAAGK